MSGFYLRLLMLPLLIFTAALLLIHAQPYDDRDLRELLLPEGCPAPCFMGIRPGVTTVDDAVMLLEANEWVTHEFTYDLGSVYSWSWSGRQPAIIDASERFRINTSTTVGGDKIVYEMDIHIKASIGSIMLLVDNPLSFLVLKNSGELGSHSANVVYLRYDNMRIEGATFCPSTVEDVIGQRATMILYDRHNANFFPEEHFWDYRYFSLALKESAGCK